MSEGRKNNQIGLNRNTDVLPFDEHRVKLRELINGRDYVNANWLSKMANKLHIIILHLFWQNITTNLPFFLKDSWILIR